MADKKITELPAAAVSSIEPGVDVIPIVNDGITKKVTLADAVLATIEAEHFGVTSVNTRTGTVVLDKTDVGLDNVDNTSDANKPVSTAQQTALNLKANVASPTFTGTVSGITKTMVGLGNVDNTSDVNKPVSTAQQTALDLKTNLSQMSGFYGSRVTGLIGAVNATTPLTKYDLQATFVTLRNSSGETVTRSNTSTLTCDLSLAGSSANGRDQLAAFTASSWIYLYFIWNGTTLATLASTTIPTSFTGSTLPSGYTHWAFATAIRWNASSNIIPALVRGAYVLYDNDVTAIRVVSGGAATVYTAVSLAAFIPPIALRPKVSFILSYTTGSAPFPLEVFYRATGSTKLGSTVAMVVATAISPNVFEVVNVCDVALSASQQLDYKLSAVPASGGLYLDVFGYAVPNGDA